jgi:osmotically-inducible protein OsmY
MRLTHAVAAVSVALLASTFAASCGKSVAQTVDDGGITVRVRTALLNAPDVSATEMTVSTSGGVVTLSGKARSAEERDRAIAIARKVNGVTDVRSNVEVPAPAPVSQAASSKT